MGLLAPLEPHKAQIAAAALLAFLAAVVAVINWQGRKLRKHEDVLRVVSIRLDNLNKERAARDKAALQTARPPTLSDAPTVNVTSEMLETLVRNTKKEPTNNDH